MKLHLKDHAAKSRTKKNQMNQTLPNDFNKAATEAEALARIANYEK